MKQDCKWIADKGTCGSDQLENVIRQRLGAENACFLAMMTDEFYADTCSGENLQKIRWPYLLEIRVFNEQHEFLAVRGSIGEKFGWRLTDDTGLEETDKLVYTQFLDINDEKSKEKDGRLFILSTVGGAYSLPVTKALTRVRIMNYIRYDENGMAKIADSRVVCFTE